MNRPFVALDRDGTIIVEKHYLSDPDQVELLPGAAEGLRRMQKAGMLLFLVTNQSAVGRGIFDLARLEQIHQRLRNLLAEERVKLDAIFFCPHKPDDQCTCRKPLTGMMDQAVRELAIEPCDGFVIGDKVCDIDLGKRSGARTILVRTGYGASEKFNENLKPDYIVNDLSAAAELIQNHLREQPWK